MKVIIPVAGVGSRLKPHTFSTPKPLVEVAGKSILSYILDEVVKLSPSEIILIVGHLKNSIENFTRGYLPKENLKFIYQELKNGDGGAIKLALDYMKIKDEEDEDVFIVFGDTLIDFNLKESLKRNQGFDGIIFSREVEEPQHYGILYVDKDDIISNIIEKPENPKSNIAVIGAYWFNSFYKLSNKVDEIFEKHITSKGEYKLADVIKLFVRDKIDKNRIKSVKVDGWFDCGRPEVLLEANKYYLSKLGNSKKILKDDSVIIGPSYISKNAIVKKSIIGPNTSISTEAYIENSIIENCIIGKGAHIYNLHLKDSLIGKEVVLKGTIKKLNIGEKSDFSLE